MPTKRITRFHSPDSVDDKKLVKNEAENGQLFSESLRPTKVSPRQEDLQDS